MRSCGRAVEEKRDSGFIGYPEVRSSLHSSPTTNVALVNGSWSPILMKNSQFFLDLSWICQLSLTLTDPNANG